MTKHTQEKWFKAYDSEPFNAEDNVGAMPTHQNYVDRYNKAKFKPNSGLGIQVICDKIQKNKDRYVTVEKETGVPWQLIGALHAMESSLDFNTWLANGDSLSGPTRNDPPGLKLTGKYKDKWTDGAVISLEHEGFDGLKFGDIGDILIAAESYNGLGYLTGAGRATTPPETSPYLWSGTDQYVKGKYIADGKFDREAVSGQAGVVGIFKELAARGEMNLKGSKDEPKPSAEVTWVKFFRDGFVNTIIGYAGDKAVEKLNTSDKKELIKFLEKHTKAGTFHVALPGEAIPGSNPNPEPIPTTEQESFILVTKAQQSALPNGLVPLNYQFYDKLGMLKGTVKGASGVPSAQFFRTGRDSMPGSLEPLPEGRWSLRDMEWKNGKDNYDAWWADNIGPMFQDWIAEFDTRRSAIGAHLEAGAVGTAGCPGIIDILELKKYVQLTRLLDPKKAYVNWGLGTCPATPKING